MKARIYTLVIAATAASMIVANAAAAADVATINSVLGTILLTNIGLVLGVVFNAGISLQRLRSLEDWRKEVKEALPEYERSEVLDEKLENIADRLDKIERLLEIR